MPALVDLALESVVSAKHALAVLPAAQKAALARSLVSALATSAEAMATAACRMADVEPTGRRAGLAYLTSAVPVLRAAAELSALASDRMAPGKLRRLRRALRTGRSAALVLDLTPKSVLQRTALGVHGVSVVLEEGTRAEDALRSVANAQAQQSPGAVKAILVERDDVAAAVLGVLDALFVEGRVSVVALGASDSSARGLLEGVLSPLVTQGYVRVVPVALRAQLAQHSAVDSVQSWGVPRFTTSLSGVERREPSISPPWRSE